MNVRLLQRGYHGTTCYDLGSREGLDDMVQGCVAAPCQGLRLPASDEVPTVDGTWITEMDEMRGYEVRQSDARVSVQPKGAFSERGADSRTSRTSSERGADSDSRTSSERGAGTLQVCMTHGCFGGGLPKVHGRNGRDVTTWDGQTVTFPDGRVEKTHAIFVFADLASEVLPVTEGTRVTMAIPVDVVPASDDSED